MAWSRIPNSKVIESQSKSVAVPDSIWMKCPSCKSVLIQEAVRKNFQLCTECSYHFNMKVWDRINLLTDAQSFVEHDIHLQSKDPLEFVDKNSYREKLNSAQKKLNRKDAIVCGSAKLNDYPVQLGVFDFEFMGGSMGTVVGEKIKNLYARSAENLEPAIIVSSSGGARMHEGILSLMQMAKTCAALSLLRDRGVPFISILTHPTTGGVAASFAMLGDINIGEPGALIGFAGPRVIQQTIGQELPEGFQTSEFLMSHGMLDLICDRRNLKQSIADILAVVHPRVRKSIS